MAASTPPLRDFLPEQPVHTYPAANVCIYCQSRHDLSDEHIIPYGMGGRLLLPKSSCKACSTITSEIERTCLRKMYGPLRLLYGLPSRRRKARPDKLPLMVKHRAGDEWSVLHVPQDRYPFLVTFPYLSSPGLLAGEERCDALGPVTDRVWIRGASPSHSFHSLLASLRNELGVHAIQPTSDLDVAAFCRLLAKVAIAYVAAERESSEVSPALASMVIGNKLEGCRYFIGGSETNEPAVNRLHEISLTTFQPSNILAVRIRFLAKLGTPTYWVALGKARNWSTPKAVTMPFWHPDQS